MSNNSNNSSDDIGKMHDLRITSTFLNGIKWIHKKFHLCDNDDTLKTLSRYQDSIF